MLLDWKQYNKVYVSTDGWHVISDKGKWSVLKPDGTWLRQPGGHGKRPSKKCWNTAAQAINEADKLRA